MRGKGWLGCSRFRSWEVNEGRFGCVEKIPWGGFVVLWGSSVSAVIYKQGRGRCNDDVFSIAWHCDWVYAL